MWFLHRWSVWNPVLENSHNFSDTFWHSHIAGQSHHCRSEQPDGHRHLFKELYYIRQWSLILLLLWNYFLIIFSRNPQNKNLPFLSTYFNLQLCMQKWIKPNLHFRIYFVLFAAVWPACMPQGPWIDYSFGKLCPHVTFCITPTSVFRFCCCILRRLFHTDMQMETEAAEL
jgi:hypothetical protein